MSNRFVLPFQTVLDTNGDPVSGAKINAYKTGTVTRLDTYSDDALTTANANPIVADSAGRFEAPFLKDEDYKFVITDSADVEIGTYDPVRGGVDNLADDTIRSALDSGGSANAYTLTVNRTFSAYANGQEFTFKANFANTGAATLNVTPGDSGASALGAKSIVWPDGTATASGDIPSGAWVTVRYDGTNFQLISVTNPPYPVATQAEMEAASATDRVVTPGRAHNHPGVAKFWIRFDGTSTISINGEYGVSTIQDNGTGDYTINFDTPFSTANWAVAGMTNTVGTGISVSAMSTTNIQVLTFTTSTPSASDRGIVTVVGFGDQ